MTKMLIDVEHLGPYDAMVVMRSKTTELCFVMKNDMPQEAFVGCCERLRKLVLENELGVKVIDRKNINDAVYMAQFGLTPKGES